MDHPITLTVAPESDVRDVASNPLGGLTWPTEALPSGLNPGVLDGLDGITAAALGGLTWPTEALPSGLSPGVLGNLDGITAAALGGLTWPTEALPSGLSPGVLDGLDGITAAALGGLTWPTEALPSGLSPGVLGNLDGITAAALGGLTWPTEALPSGLDWQPSWAIPEVLYVYPERRQTAQVSRLPERGPDVRHHHDLLGSFDNQITFSGLVQCTRALFADEHYSVAVEKAFVYVENLVKQQSGSPGKHGSSLMKTVFSVHNPSIRLNAGVTDSDRAEQLGYMELFAGAMTGIRNPRAHSHNWIDHPEEALELLVFANLLVRKILMATSSRISK